VNYLVGGKTGMALEHPRTNIALDCVGVVRSYVPLNVIGLMIRVALYTLVATAFGVRYFVYEVIAVAGERFFACLAKVYSIFVLMYLLVFNQVGVCVEYIFAESTSVLLRGLVHPQMVEVTSF
jgi:hypothetical protein